ncbi:MAG: 30S ribosomal protein S16 [Deltaproteobacteria bacterium]|nr:30S ribosomal protein S16 [Deltaproteobacteria bacterium]
MATRIRLARHGAKKRPYYRIVVSENTYPRDGKFIETVGTYNPLTEPATITLKEDRIKHWIEKGAIPTHTVQSILRKAAESSAQTA